MVSGSSLGLKRSQPLSDAILKLIWEQRRISRADIARQTGLAKSTVSEVVGNMLKTDMVCETGTGASGGGRQPIILEFQDEARCILGVEIGATHVAVALTDMRARILAWAEADHPVRSDPVGTRALIGRLCQQCLDNWGGEAHRLMGIGIGVPSPVDPHRPEELSEVVIPAWQGKVGLGALRERYMVPLYVDNDANLGALSEYWWGAGRGIDDFIYIKAATGIGAGYILDGRIYKGGMGYAGEIGHLAIDPDGKPCLCGMRGCLVTKVGADALVERAQTLCAEGKADSPLCHQTLNLQAIERAARANDPLALQIVNEAAEAFGIAIAGLLNVLNPSAIVLGGSLADLGLQLLEPLKRAVESRTILSRHAPTVIKTGQLGSQSVALGAATLVLKEALDNPRLLPELNL